MQKIYIPLTVNNCNFNHFKLALKNFNNNNKLKQPYDRGKHYNNQQ